MQTIEITISGGAVQYVDFPRGVKVIIRDYDVEGGDLEGPDIRKDEEDDYFQNMEFIHDEDRPLEDQNADASPAPVQSARVFKLWVSIEAIQEDRGIYEDLTERGFIEPVSLGIFSNLSQALKHVLDLPGCLKDERDDAMLKRADKIEREIWEQIDAPSAEKEAPGCQGTLNLEVREKYLRTRGVRCPFCGSERIEGGSFEGDGDTVWQDVECQACTRSWRDLYSLSDILFKDEKPGPHHTAKAHQPSANTFAHPANVMANLSGVDWKLLRRQKESLLRAISVVDAHISKKCQEDLTGILHLLDDIQDQAADRLGESAVFGKHRGGSAHA